MEFIVSKKIKTTNLEPMETNGPTNGKDKSQDGRYAFVEQNVHRDRLEDPPETWVAEHVE